MCEMRRSCVCDVSPVAPDIVEDQPFAQRQIAERELLGTQPAQDGVDQDGTRDREVGATRIEPRE